MPEKRCAIAAYQYFCVEVYSVIAMLLSLRLLKGFVYRLLLDGDR
jgi:hypothetical protein